MGNSQKDEKVVMMEGTSILVAGPNRLQNELIASFLQKETSRKSVALDNNGQSGSHHPPGEEYCLLLYDCMGGDVDACMEQCAGLLEKNPSIHRVCFLNMRKGSGVEESLVNQGVSGFFYEGEPLQTFTEGVRAVLNGQFWVSRRILTRLIEKNNMGAKGVPKNILSPREVDILNIIVEGGSNDEIADKLCISKFTVKTHLYNIFKKLNVKSRFQAALWAAKHL